MLGSDSDRHSVATVHVASWSAASASAVLMATRVRLVLARCSARRGRLYCTACQRTGALNNGSRSLAGAASVAVHDCGAQPASQECRTWVCVSHRLQRLVRVRQQKADIEFQVCQRCHGPAGLRRAAAPRAAPAPARSPCSSCASPARAGYREGLLLADSLKTGVLPPSADRTSSADYAIDKLSSGPAP